MISLGLSGHDAPAEKHREISPDTWGLIWTVGAIPAAIVFYLAWTGRLPHTGPVGLLCAMCLPAFVFMAWGAVDCFYRAHKQARAEAKRLELWGQGLHYWDKEDMARWHQEVCSQTTRCVCWLAPYVPGFGRSTFHLLEGLAARFNVMSMEEMHVRFCQDNDVCWCPLFLYDFPEKPPDSTASARG